MKKYPSGHQPHQRRDGNQGKYRYQFVEVSSSIAVGEQQLPGTPMGMSKISLYATAGPRAQPAPSTSRRRCPSPGPGGTASSSSGHEFCGASPEYRPRTRRRLLNLDGWTQKRSDIEGMRLWLAASRLEMSCFRILFLMMNSLALRISLPEHGFLLLVMALTRLYGTLLMCLSQYLV